MITSNLNTLLKIVKEFLKSLTQKRTYDVFQNGYSIFGILWGVPIPIVTIGIDLYLSRLSPTLDNIIAVILGHPFHFFFFLHPLFFGIVFGAMGTVRYNKEQKIKEFEESVTRKNRELKENYKKLKEVDELKSSFLSMVSHELRTPLTTIQGYISFLLTEKSGTLNPAQREYLKTSEEETELLNHLIEELLDLSRIEKGEFRVNLESVDIKETITKAVTSLRLFADAQGVILENDLPQELPLVWADQERIFQVVTNLLGNAIKFNRRAGKVSISSCGHPENKKLTFCISDTGIGIKEDDLDKIFNKFYQVEPLENRRLRGCGLGLAITKSILELHQGRIWVESKVGAGSTFFFELKISAHDT